MFCVIGAISGHFEGVGRALRQTREGGGIFIVRNVVGHLIVICIKYNVGFTIGIASVGCPADGGTGSGDALIINRGRCGFKAGRSYIDGDVVDVDTVGHRRGAGRFGQHDGHIAVSD